MARLYAPLGVLSLGIEDEDYTVGDDGTVDVRQKHVAHAQAHGFTVRPPAPPAPAPQEVEAELRSGLTQALQRIAALEGELGAIKAQLAAPTPADAGKGGKS
jgi:hypothetical protein